MLSVAAVALCSALGAVPADDFGGHHLFAGGSSLSTHGADGTPGLNRLDTAEPTAPGEVVLGLGGEYFSARGFLVSGDTTRRTSGRLVLGFSPLEMLSLWVSWEAVSGYNDRLTPRVTGYRGDPTFGVKARHELLPGVDAALALSVMVPTSAVGGGLEPGSGVYTARAIVSYAPGPGVVAALNLGYALDRSMRLFERELTSPERFAAGVYGVDAVVYGAGVQGLFAFTPDLAAGGFLELTGTAPTGAGDAPSPLRASIGLKGLVPPSRALELMLGADVRVSGAPEQGTAVPGIPPWEVFLRLTGRWAAFAEAPALAVVPTPPPPPGCDEARPCEEGRVCAAGQCVEAPREAPPAVQTFEIAGKVVDKVSGAPVPAALVTFSGWAAPPVTLDPGQATFTLGPIPVDAGLVQVRVEASGFRPTEATFAKGPAGSTKVLTLELVPVARSAPGVLKGIISDARTGRPVRGTVTIPALKTRVKVDDDGSFSVELRAGRYDVSIASPRHVSQTKSVQLRPGDVVILNLDMTPRDR